MSDAARLGAIEARCVRIVRRSLDLAPVRGIERSTHFARDLGADNLDMLTLAMAMEEEFGFAVSDVEAEVCDTLGALIDMAAAKFAGCVEPGCVESDGREGWMA